MITLRTLLLLAGSLLLQHLVWAAPEDELRLVPFPKEVRLAAGDFSLSRELVFEAPEGEAESALRPLNRELERAGLRPARARASTSVKGGWRLGISEGGGALPEFSRPGSPEAYALDVRADEVVCAAAEAAGRQYGLQTLCQLIRANRNGQALPCLVVRDWPSLRWRCFQDDMTRGPSSRLETLKFEADLGSYLKLNLMTFYMEYQYAFKKHPQIGPVDGSLTPEELSTLVDYVKPLHLDILGNQQSFGHFSWILKHPEFAALRETPDVLTPVREETYRLLDDMYSEVCPRLPFPWFNVCCDETWGLGTGPSRELAAQIGVGGLYVRHIQRVHDLLRDRHGKRMMMWGDIILQHADHLKDIPNDMILLTWGYDARTSFEDQIVPFAKSGFEFFVCPGVNNWSRILPDFGVAVTNIQNFVRDGVKHGAIGMLNTDWEDDGEAINAVKWHADAWAAECAWNGSQTGLEAFNRRIGAVLFGEKGDHFGKAVSLLTQTHRLPGMNGMMNSRFWDSDFVPKTKITAVQASASNLLAIVRPALGHLAACQAEARCNQNVLDALRFGARRMEWIGQRMLDGVEVVQRYERACQDKEGEASLDAIEQLVRQNRAACAAFGREFAGLWLSESKPYALDWTLRRYTNAVGDYDALLGKLAAARTEARAGKPLPLPESLGLAVPRPVGRLVRPVETLATALASEARWAFPSATHRLGVVVSAGESDRHHLPVELELAVPSELRNRPVRALLLDANGEGREVLAQLDPLPQAGKSRLVLVFEEPVARGQSAAVQVYFGATEESGAVPGRVKVSAEKDHRYWFENDRVRGLLGREGAHVYRWEVKALGGRDLTMPGETEWHGFSDIGSFRGSPYRIVCTGRGPALAEFQCATAEGHEKTIRLYGGANWLEVFVAAPTSVYWDFDDPRNFAADGPRPGHWLFSDGATGEVGREADGVPAQVKAGDTYWGAKFGDEKLVLALITPGRKALHVVAPGSGAGGVGIEGGPPAQHFVTVAGVFDQSPAETLNRLQATLDLARPVRVRLHAWQERTGAQR